MADTEFLQELGGDKFVPGTELIPFKDLVLNREIGRGNFGCVYIGDYLGTEVAVKECFSSKDFSEERYFLREISNLRELRHPNIVQFMGYAINDGKLYLLTEFVEGINLRKWIEDDSLEFSWRTRLSFATDIARALAYLHARNIIHRDLKGENVLTTENGRCKVCDFGFSRYEPKTPEERTRLSYCGTESHMAPEMILCLDFDWRVDVFSYGVMLCELLCRHIADEEFPLRVVPGFGLELSSIVPRADKDAPEGFFDLMAQCVQQDPKRRPDWKYILHKLRSFELGLPRIENLGVYSQAPSKLIRSASADLDNSGEDYDDESGAITPTALNPPKIALMPGHNPVPADDRRVGHKIPHRFTVVVAKALNKCKNCKKVITLGHKCLRCDDCSFVYHRKCGELAPPNCGLTADLSTSFFAYSNANLKK